MDFRIADTFTGSLAKLTGQEQKAVKTTAFDLQLNPAKPGMSFHKLDRAKDPNFWSVRVNADIRIIVHKTASSLLLVYVDHHDKAYKWAEKRKIERHPKTGAAQLVEIKETVEEVIIHRPVEAPTSANEKPILFAHILDDELLGYGVPAEWIDDVRQANEDTIFDLAERLPQEAAEALLDLAIGVSPKPAIVMENAENQFDHPDAQRRFRVLTNVEELERALDYPWEEWTVFLHPAQRQYVEKEYSGPARISGTAGTGKTIVALHRAVFLARKHPDAKILLTTFSETLAHALRVKLDRLIGNETQIADRITVASIDKIGEQLYETKFGRPTYISQEKLKTLLTDAAASVDISRFTLPFIYGEWTDIVDAWQLRTWEDYRDVSRLGRRTRIGGKQREALWSIFENVRSRLQEEALVTRADVFAKVSETIVDEAVRPFDYAIIDESQDFGVAEIRLLAAMGANKADALFFAGDLGQRIFQLPFSWKSMGIDIRGRSHTLRINYRTSHQIRSHADKLLPSSLIDVDGNVESRKDAVSVFNGPKPEVVILNSEPEEIEHVKEWISKRLNDGHQLHEIGVFVRSDAQIGRANEAVKASGSTPLVLGDMSDTEVGTVSVGRMHLAKGLEFRAVVVMACDDEVIPLQDRIENIADEADLEEVYNTERHLLYVACTRARDRLLITGIDPASEFLDDLVG